MRKLLLLALLCATSASSYLLQAQNNQSTENLKTDSLQPLVIEEINKRIINEYNSIIRHTKRRNYNKFTTSYSISQDDGEDDSNAIKLEGSTTFASQKIGFPLTFYYSLLPTNDSTATFWSAWNIYWAGYSMDYIWNRYRKKLKLANLSRKLLIHKESDGQVSTYTLYTKDLPDFDGSENSVISIKYSTLQKKIFEFSRTAENGVFLQRRYEKVITTIKGNYHKNELIPTEITTMVKKKGCPPIYIKNYNIKYGHINREEYKFLKSINAVY